MHLFIMLGEGTFVVCHSHTPTVYGFAHANPHPTDTPLSPKNRTKTTHMHPHTRKNTVWPSSSPHNCFSHLAIIERMFGHETRPGHFLIPTAIVIVGGLFTRISGWEYIGYTIWGIAGLCAFFLVYSAVKDHELKRIQEEHYHYAEIIKLDVARNVTKVVVNKTDIAGNTFSEGYAMLHIQPAKLKIFAEKVLNGHPLTIREWTPIKDGKLFSDGEWRRLIAFMKNPIKDDPRVKFIVPINEKDERKGFELTPAGRKWLENIVETRVLAPVAA